MVLLFRYSFCSIAVSIDHSSEYLRRRKGSQESPYENTFANEIPINYGFRQELN